MSLCIRERQKRSRLRLFALASAAMLMASAIAMLAPGTANAETGYETIVMTHVPNVGMYAEQGVTQGSEVGVDGAPGLWYGQQVSETDEDGISGEGYIFYSITDIGDISTWVLSDVTDGGQADLANFAANGTVFVLVPSEGGYIMYSRYFLNKGEQVVLATTYPLTGNGSVYLVPYDELGSIWYYRWSFPES